ncbi:MAG: TauD/TfdA family dioxygenase [Polyangia bacterium]
MSGALASWQWSDHEGPARLRRELEGTGYTLLRLDEERARAAARSAPFLLAERLLGGAKLERVEQQPIRAVPGARSFAASQGPAPLHSDSQLHFGVPPHLQIMVCVRPADSGGESLLLDVWPLLHALERDDPERLRRLLTVPRRIPFVFGDVVGPTLSWRGGSLVFTHSPMAPRAAGSGSGAAPDPESAPAQALIESVPPQSVPVRAGEILVLNNHRVLHGRRGFADARREFTRLLVWLRAPLPSPPRLAEQAAAEALRSAERLRDQPLALRHLGLAPPPPPHAQARLDLVLALLRGVPPGLLAARSGLPEPALYRLCEAALAAAGEALGGALGEVPAAADGAELDRLLAQLRRDR